MAVQPVQRTWIDSIALYYAIEDARLERRMSWREVGREMDITPSFFTRLKEGRVPDTSNVCLACDWLGAKIDDFRAPDGERLPPSRPRIPDEILYASLSQEQVDAINRREFGSDYNDAPGVATGDTVIFESPEFTDLTT